MDEGECPTEGQCPLPWTAVLLLPRQRGDVLQLRVLHLDDGMGLVLGLVWLLDPGPPLVDPVLVRDMSPQLIQLAAWPAQNSVVATATDVRSCGGWGVGAS